MAEPHASNELDARDDVAATGAKPSRRVGRPVRILYALGPGDVVQFYRDLTAGHIAGWRLTDEDLSAGTLGLYPTDEDLSAGTPGFQMSMAFSKQFLDWCDQAGEDQATHDQLGNEQAQCFEPRPDWRSVVVHGISSHSRADCFQVGLHCVENRPKQQIGNGHGWRFYIGQLRCMGCAWWDGRSASAPTW